MGTEHNSADIAIADEKHEKLREVCTSLLEFGRIFLRDERGYIVAYDDGDYTDFTNNRSACSRPYACSARQDLTSPAFQSS